MQDDIKKITEILVDDFFENISYIPTSKNTIDYNQFFSLNINNRI